MRILLSGVLLLLSGCSPGLEFNSSPDMTPAEMLDRASLIFVGVIEKQQFDSWPFFRLVSPTVDPDSAHYWKVLRRRVRVELPIHGTVKQPQVDVYEIFWTGGTTGDWNSTFDGERALFLVRTENGRHHVVRDWWRSIFPVTTGRHTRLPLDDNIPLWERIALMNWWIERLDPSTRVLRFHYNDPADALGQWRTVKLLRGLVLHPNARVRVSACRDLLLLAGWGQDECWERLSDTDKTHLSDGGYISFSAERIASGRRIAEERGALWHWKSYRDRDMHRLLTAHSVRTLRGEFCHLWAINYPDDFDNGCPADEPPPATIVTSSGDIPLSGKWPAQ